MNRAVSMHRRQGVKYLSLYFVVHRNLRVLAVPPRVIASCWQAYQTF